MIYTKTLHPRSTPISNPIHADDEMITAAKSFEISFFITIFLEESNNYQHKPVVYVFEARYYIEVKKDKERMLESYDKAILFAKMLNDDVLVRNLEMEKNNDLARI